MQTFKALPIQIFILVVILSSFAFGRGRKHDEGGKRKGKIFSVFQIIRFPNNICNGGSKNGTCYTEAECSSKGGTNDGSCASGYGVCCTFTLSCGGMSSENCTYFDSDSPMAGACSVQICPCNDNICQLRLDFISFTITGPQTSSVSAVKTNNGFVVSSGGNAQSLATQCLTDNFSVSSSGITPPIICGINSGKHMYVDSDTNCNALTFQLGSASGVNQPTLATRTWSIKINQYSCNYGNLAPSGCTEYFFDPTGSGTLETYNFNGGTTTATGAGYQLANQQQQQCIRRERGNCRICYFAVIATNFDVSGQTGDKGIVGGDMCCGHKGEGMQGYDCIQIPGAVKATDDAKLVTSNICGKSGLVSTDGNAFVSICSTQSPFVLNYRTDAYEGASANTDEAGNDNVGYLLNYVQDAINC